MTKRSRRTHAPAREAKVTLAAIKGEKTLAELAQQFDVHANQITTWKGQLLEGAVWGLRAGEGGFQEAALDLKSLHAKLGELALENDFLSGALTKSGTTTSLSSGRRKRSTSPAARSTTSPGRYRPRICSGCAALTNCISIIPSPGRGCCAICCGMRV